MNVNKIRKVCRVVRIVVGLALIGVGAYYVLNATPETPANYLWFLGAIPLIAGLVNFCPLCLITKQCDIPEPKSNA
ncbi:MAG: hypothetical protein ACI9TV_001511 [Sulfurimonas sp.]|jgi:hypothetical protein|uniref:YgaP family membrane protein n=1 Tax=Sulfurimonas sp. TaxID=2022749 RepID=UPI0039E3A406